ncbi:MAG: carboxypeptidase-like regulatory domain-containing protein, partial [Dolichospermum sp.]
QAGITVTATDKNGVVYTTTSQQYGRWTINTIPAGAYPVRVEFTGLPGYASKGTLNGADGRTTVQFINAPDCNVDLGILNNADYCNSKNSKIAVPIFQSGDPLPSGSSVGTKPAFVHFPYGTSGPRNPSGFTVLATAAQVGSLFGVVF